MKGPIPLGRLLSFRKSLVNPLTKTIRIYTNKLIVDGGRRLLLRSFSVTINLQMIHGPWYL